MMAVSYGVYYNADLFDQLEIAVPTTWEELIIAAETIQAAGYSPFANGTKDTQNIEDTIFKGMILPNFTGGKEGRLAYLAGERCFNDDDMLSAFEAVDQIAPMIPSAHASLSYYDAQQSFWSGDAAMLLDGSWTIAATESAQPDFNWSIFAMPAPENQSTTLTVNPDFGIAMNANTSHPEEARLFLEWLMTTEALALFQDHLPGFFALHNQAPIPQSIQAQAFYRAHQEYATDILWDLPAGLPDGNHIMQQGTIAIIAGESTPKQVAQALQQGMAQWYEPAQSCSNK
jgi:raffinose/stachyose/melibiose transport system substrate-binding protein